jgi:hypothetical protein
LIVVCHIKKTNQKKKQKQQQQPQTNFMSTNKANKKILVTKLVARRPVSKPYVGGAEFNFRFWRRGTSAITQGACFTRIPDKQVSASLRSIAAYTYKLLRSDSTFASLAETYVWVKADFFSKVGMQLTCLTIEKKAKAVALQTVPQRCKHTFYVGAETADEQTVFSNGNTKATEVYTARTVIRTEIDKVVAQLFVAPPTLCVCSTVRARE